MRLLIVLALLFVARAPLGAQAPGLVSGATWERRLGVEEAQALEDASQERVYSSRRLTLSATLSWRVTSAARARVVLRCAVVQGELQSAVLLMSRGETRLGVPLEGLLIDVVLSEGRCRAALEPASWRRTLEETLRVHGGRVTREGLADLGKELLGMLERVHAVAIGLASPTTPDTPPSLPTWPLLHYDGRPSGELGVMASAGVHRLFAAGTGREVPLLRRHRSRGGAFTDLDERGALAWQPSLAGFPEIVCLEATGRYVDRAETKSISLPEDAAPRQVQAVKICLTLPAATGKSLAEITGLPPRLELTDYARFVTSEEDRRELGEILTGADSHAAGFLAALERYEKLEATGERSLALRAAVHFALVERFAVLTYTAAEKPLRAAVEERVRAAAGAPFIWALRAACHPHARLRDEERVTLCRAALDRPEPALARWGGLWLGHGRWPGAAEAIVAALAREEAKGESGSLPLRRSLAADLRHWLVDDADGKRLAGLQVIWTAARRDTRSPTVVEPPRLAPTASHFAEPRGIVVVVEAGRGTGDSLQRTLTGRAGPPGNDPTVFDAFKTYLLRLLEALPENALFDVILAGDRPRPLSGSLALATKKKIEATSFMVKLARPGSGSQLLEALKTAFRYETVDTILVIGGH